MISHWILESIDSNPESIKSILRPIDSEDRSSSISFGDPPIPLQHNDFGPDFIINVVPLLQDLGDVILKYYWLIKHMSEYWVLVGWKVAKISSTTYETAGFNWDFQQFRASTIRSKMP